MNPCGVKATKIWGHLLLNIIQPLLIHTIGLEAKLHSGPELIWYIKRYNMVLINFFLHGVSKKLRLHILKSVSAQANFHFLQFGIHTIFS